jgi:hypothetical protein
MDGGIRADGTSHTSSAQLLLLLLLHHHAPRGVCVVLRCGAMEGRLLLLTLRLLLVGGAAVVPSVRIWVGELLLLVGWMLGWMHNLATKGRSSQLRVLLEGEREFGCPPWEARMDPYYVRRRGLLEDDRADFSGKTSLRGHTYVTAQHTHRQLHSRRLTAVNTADELNAQRHELAVSRSS